MTPDQTLCDYDPAGEWRLRVVPNLYPAVTSPLASHGSAAATIEDVDHVDRAQWSLKRVPAMGFHEVIIEGPHHNVPLALAPTESVESVVMALRTRGREMIAADSSLRHIMYFKNSGLKAGASLLHPHSQVIGLPILPNEVARRQRHAREWYRRFQRNVFEVTIEETLRERDQAGAEAADHFDAADGTSTGRPESGAHKHRVVHEDRHFVCFVP
jgi:UDPglucose--hexose-1-phosphate uridylyltransferase